jgi:hypothetical protein
MDNGPLTKLLVTQMDRGSEGGTFTRDGEYAMVSRGYWVGGGAKTLIVNPKLERKIAFNDIWHWLNDLPKEVRFIGWWLYRGKYYFDATELVIEKDEALRLAKERGEFAIWDIMNGEEIKGV